MPPEYTPELIARFWSKVDKTGDCWLWTAGTSQNGYGRFHIMTIPRYAHRIAWEIANGPIPDGLLVCHRCDVRLCCNPDHLFIGTHSDNSSDMANKGRAARGERHNSVTHPDLIPHGSQHWNSKLTPELVREIRERSRNGERSTDLARCYGVTDSTIYTVIKRKAWKHV